MENFFEHAGMVATGSRLRLLTDMITRDNQQIYSLYNVEIQPKWYPVIAVLAENGSSTITEIAKIIGQTHPSVSYIVKELSLSSLIEEADDSTDKRQNKVKLTPKGQKTWQQMKQVLADVETAVCELNKHTTQNLWIAIAEWQKLLSEKSLLERVRTVKNGKVTILDYDNERHHPGYKALNEQWIAQLFEIEEADRLVLDHPIEKIIDKGGFILMAEFMGKVVGTCSMVKTINKKYDYELAKFAVDPNVQGKGIGSKLMKACLDRAHNLGATRIFLETNHNLQAAIHLYEKFNFKRIPLLHPGHIRTDILMEHIG